MFNDETEDVESFTYGGKNTLVDIRNTTRPNLSQCYTSLRTIYIKMLKSSIRWMKYSNKKDPQTQRVKDK